VVGKRTADGAAQELGVFGSFQMAQVSPATVNSPTAPPKVTAPSVADSKSPMELVPLSTMVGKVKFHHLKPVMAAPDCGSDPLAVPLEIKGSVTV
jgi:hypothetical protein